MKIPYYPGCTLKDRTKDLEISTQKVANTLNIELQEPKRWSCCGTTFPLTEEKIVGLVAPIRILRDIKEEGHKRLVTSCPFCYNVLKRSNETIKQDPIKLKRVNAYLKDDITIEGKTREKKTNFPEYKGEVEIIHLLQLLQEFGFERVKEKTKRPLKGLKIAPYYGCQLLRPKEIAIDDPEQPKIMEELFSLLGCEPVDFPFKTECCGSYLTASNPEIGTETTYPILRYANKFKVDIIVTTCPLCFYNLDQRQKEIKERFPDIKSIPILFFTEVLAMALEKEKLLFKDHLIDPNYVFERYENASV